MSAEKAADCRDWFKEILSAVIEFAATEKALYDGALRACSDETGRAVLTVLRNRQAAREEFSRKILNGCISGGVVPPEIPAGPDDLQDLRYSPHPEAFIALHGAAQLERTIISSLLDAAANNAGQWERNVLERFIAHAKQDLEVLANLRYSE